MKKDDKDLSRSGQSGRSTADLRDGDRSDPPHHCAPGDYVAMIRHLRAIESGRLSPAHIDWRTQAGVLWRMLQHALAGVSPVPPDFAPGIDVLMSVNAALHAVGSQWRIALEQGQAIAVPTPDVHSSPMSPVPPDAAVEQAKAALQQQITRLAVTKEPMHVDDEIDALIAAVRAEQAARLHELEAEREAIYALGKGPIEQARSIPLAQWVQTRFVHIGDHNADVAELLHALDAVIEERDNADARLARLKETP